MKITDSKKAITMTWSEIVYFIVGFAVLCVIAIFVITSGTTRVEREIKAQTDDIRSGETLVFYLADQITKDPEVQALMSNEAYAAAQELADSKITFADLIVMLDEEETKVHKEVLEKETEYVLNNTLGNNKWKLNVKYPLKEVSLGGFVGESRVYQARIPARGYQLIIVELISKTE